MFQIITQIVKKSYSFNNFKRRQTQRLNRIKANLNLVKKHVKIKTSVM